MDRRESRAGCAVVELPFLLALGVITIVGILMAPRLPAGQ